VTQPRLNIVGPGRVGSTLGRLLQQAGTCAVQDVVGENEASAQSAIQFIGGGCALGAPDGIRPAELWLLTPHDAGIEAVAAALAGTGSVRSGDIAFHCSGALSSEVLAPLKAAGAYVASLHPLKSFADPAIAVTTFAGTYCAAEGDDAALKVISPLFEKLGARVSRIDAAGKTLYHAGSVLVCNALTALMETGLRAYESAGLERAAAQAMMEPLVRETLDNVFALGTTRALTGPVARGDAAVVARQLAALQALDPRIAEAYRALNDIALDLARRQGGASAAALDAVERSLKNTNKNI